LCLLFVLVACTKTVKQEITVEDNVVIDIKQEPVIDNKFDFASGKPFKCVTVVDQYTSTMYIKDSKMRIDTLPADAHAIYNGDLIYSWSGESGTVMKMSDIQKLSEGAPYKQPSQQDMLNKAKDTNSKCEPYAVSDSLFTPPADVDFKDMAEMLKQMEGYLNK
jgi:hypothetical protein